MYNIKIIDNALDVSLRKKVWNYVQMQRWSVAWKRTPARRPLLTEYYPGKNRESLYVKWMDPQLIPSMFMPRAVFASDESSLRENHPVIYELWQSIRLTIGEDFYIEGSPEGLAAQNLLTDEHWQPPPTKDSKLEPGWRVYANCQPTEYVKRSHGIHRDTIDTEDDNCYTLLYVCNLEWYPSWFAENVFYPDDEEGITGDQQQFQESEDLYNQVRNFNIGWADEGKIVSPRPGRLILYDGRCLHTTRPAAVWAKEDRKVVVFRLRKK